MKPTKMSFEKNYPDDSGVEFAVRYDGSEITDQIEIERVNIVSLPIDQIGWLIICLQEIRDQVWRVDGK